MNLSHFFIDRPIFAAVVSILITLIGGVAYFALPIAQYPEIAPPSIAVSAQYSGASAEVVAKTVATPLEQEINGVDNMLYMTSQSTSDGRMSLTVTFKLGTDLDTAQVLVQNRVAIAEPRLPQEVRNIGVNVTKQSPDLLMVIHLLSPDDSRSQLYLSNYATLHVRDVLSRIDGVGDARIFGARDYSMRVWLNPEKLAARELTAGDVVAALRAQNVQVAAGVINQPPVPQPGAFQLSVETQGRLPDADAFGNIIVKAQDGRVTRVRDIGRVELGAADYTLNGYLDKTVAIPLGIFQRPGSNALETSDQVIAAMEELSKSFPAGVKYDIVYNPTVFISQSVEAVFHTMAEAVILVIVVIVLFLQNWRASIVPIVAIPVSLIGSCMVLAALGFSINNLTLFAMVLAIGIVVDDAIVVVENVERLIREGHPPREAAHLTMDEVGGALVAISLVLGAVFIPSAFLSGITGQFFRQFAVTITTATAISLIVSLTLSPALCALLFKPHEEGHERKKGIFSRVIGGFFGGFNRGFDWVATKYGQMTGRLVRMAVVMLAIYAGLIGLTIYQFGRAPTGFIPNQDLGYLINIIQLPPGSSLARTDEVARKVVDIVLDQPGIAHAVPIVGLDGATFTNAPNSAVVFTPMDPFEERAEEGLSADAIIGSLNQKFAAIEDALLISISPPPVRGIGTTGGFKMEVQDTQGGDPAQLAAVANELAAAANQTPGFARVFTTFDTGTPKVYADIDRVKAEMLGVPVQNVFEALSVYLGSVYVNDFNFLGRTYRVTAQADGEFRQDLHTIANLKTRNNQGEMVPLGSVATFENITGPYRIEHFNIFTAAAVQGSTVPGYSSGYAIEAMERLADQVLPDGYSYAWTELAFQEKQAGDTAIYVFLAAVVFVFLLLAAQYESWSLPFSVILIVPMCLLAAITGLILRGMDVNILAQIGFVVLIGLAAKNAILIVEFAKQNEEEGEDRFEAVTDAARVRLRPILMTAFAFILGVLPLMIAQGAGAEMRQSLGTTVFTGMLGVTFFGLIFTPIFYVVVRKFAKKPKEHSAPAKT